MCLAGVEVLFLIYGLWLLISGKPPTGLFRAIFGKGQYRMSRGSTRLYGALLASPVLVVPTMSFLLSLLFPQYPKDVLAVSKAFELIYSLFIILLAIVIAERSREPVAAAERVEDETD